MRWILPNPDPVKVHALMEQFQVPEIIAQVLSNRGLENKNHAKSFFSPDLSNLHDPFLMKNMDIAVDRIIANIKSKTPIFIFGDYDIDGITGASLLYIGLLSLGATVDTYIPNRIKEGYGVSELGIDKAKKFGADLFITCDCGINAINCVNYANEKEIDVIITDHHIPGEALPNAFAILNPKQADCIYPFKGLCGGGVSFKLLTGIVQKLNASFELIVDLMDLVSLGTLADLVPMIDENRIIVHYGLQTLRTRLRPGICELLKVANIDLARELTATQIAFHVVSRINAAGRLGDANRSVKLLTTSDHGLAKQLAGELEKGNKTRQAIQRSVLDEALLQVNSEIDLEKDKAIVLGSKGWHQGVVGIVASMVKETYNRPTIIISFDEGGNGKGSARSIKGLDMHKALSASSKFLDTFGGHAMAGGLSIHESQLAEFKKSFFIYADKALNQDDLESSLVLDVEVLLADINNRFLDFLKKLAPFGPGNMRPQFALMKVQVVGNPKVIGNGNHIRFKVRQKHSTIDVVGFGLSECYQDLIIGEPIDIAGVVETNLWKGRESIQFNARDIRLSTSS